MQDRLERLCLNILGAALLVLMGAIVLQVLCSALDLNPIATFDQAVALFGSAVSLNSLLDFQWHLLVLVGLLPAGLVWLCDAHVRVDFLYMNQSDRWKARLNLLGAAVFAAPFFALVLPAAFGFVARSWRADEGSNSGGLNDLWLIKSVMPLGLALLAVAVLWDAVKLLRKAR